MKPAYRTAFFLAAVVLFLVAAPLLILRASGYRYDLEELSLVPTGTLVIKTFPEGATVWINDQKEPLTTPAEFQGLLPEHYVVRVEAEHYHPWQKRLEIKQNQVTLENQVLLIPKKIPVSTLVSAGARAFALSPDGRRLVYARRLGPDEDDQIRVFNLAEKEEYPLSLLDRAGDRRDEADSKGGSVERFLWSPDGELLAISLFEGGEADRRYFLVRAGSDEAPFELPSMPDGIHEWSWRALDQTFFFIHAGILYQADYSKREAAPLTPEPVKGYIVIRDEVFFLAASTQSLFKKNLGPGEQEPVRIAQLNAPQGGARFIPRNNTMIALLDSGGELWMVDLDGRAEMYPVARGVRDAGFNEDGSKLWFQTSDGLFVYRLERDSLLSDERPVRFERVVYSRDKIVNPTWHHRYPYIFYAGSDMVYIAPAGGGEPEAYPLIKTPGEQPKFAYAAGSSGEEKLYFLYRERIYEADLVFGRAGAPETPPLRSARAGVP